MQFLGSPLTRVFHERHRELELPGLFNAVPPDDSALCFPYVRVPYVIGAIKPCVHVGLVDKGFLEQRPYFVTLLVRILRPFRKWGVGHGGLDGSHACK